MRKIVTEYTCDVCKCEVDESILIPKTIIFNNGIEVRLSNSYEDDVCIYCFREAVNSLIPN